MPVIVVGADTPLGSAIVEALLEPDREVRAFVSDPAAAATLRRLGVKVALGDVSDPSHIEASCLNCFSAVLVTEAAVDERERAFASDRETILQGWAEAAADAAVQRVLWVDSGAELPDVVGIEIAVIDAASGIDVAREVVILDNAIELNQPPREAPPSVEP